MVSDAQERVNDAQQIVNSAQQRVNNAQQRVNVVQQMVDSAQQKVQSAQDIVDSAQMINSTQEMASGTQQKKKIKSKVKALARAEAKLEVEIKALTEAEGKLKPETNALTEAEAKVNAETKALAEALAEAETIVSITTPLHDLTTDCLHLSMHFFHPIQQCAQQVYHSALPLSPTLSQLQRFCLQNSIDGQLPHVASFSGAPETWGLLLRTIDIRPRHLTSIATSLQRIIAACEDIVNIYDAITFVLQQSLCAPETVTKIQDSTDGSMLFFAHSFSVTMWDVQTGGLIHTFTTQSKINDFAVSATGGHILGYPHQR